MIRYGYFTLMLIGHIPKSIVWLRYSAFVLIYPIGISAEMWLVYRAIGESSSIGLTGVMVFELGLYFPGKWFEVAALFVIMLMTNRYLFSVLLHVEAKKQGPELEKCLKAARYTKTIGRNSKHNWK